MGSLCHYLSHGAIIRRRKLRYACEAFFWGWLGHSATVWSNTHNKTHHAHANGRGDTDRRFFASERRWDRTLLHAIFYPNRHLKWNPFTLFTYGVLSMVYMMTALLGAGPTASPMGPVVYQYRRRERARVALELCWAYGIQIVNFQLLGWQKYLCTILVAYLITNSISSMYLHTQHGLMPLSDANDDNPLRSTASVRVNWLLNKLHCNVSYHVEHHLFPSLNYKYAPLVSELLAERYPEHYQRLSLYDAWRRLFESELYQTSPDPMPRTIRREARRSERPRLDVSPADQAIE